MTIFLLRSRLDFYDYLLLGEEGRNWIRNIPS